jgi:hypothetical protein
MAYFCDTCGRSVGNVDSRKTDDGRRVCLKCLAKEPSAQQKPEANAKTIVLAAVGTIAVVGGLFAAAWWLFG